LDGEWKRLDHPHRRRDCESVGATWGSLRPADQTAELLSQHKARCQAASRSEKGRKESASRNRSEPTGVRDSAARQYLSGIDSVGTSSHRCRSRSGHDKRQGPRRRLSCGHCVRHYASIINKKGSPGRAQQRGGHGRVVLCSLRREHVGVVQCWACGMGMGMGMGKASKRPRWIQGGSGAAVTGQFPVLGGY
jgi:hypothetical protein